MTETQLITLLLRIGLIAGFLSILLWVALYTYWARWWKNTVGRTLVIKDILIAILLIPTTLSLFVHLNRANSLTVAWIDVGLIGLIAPVMCWRVVTWARFTRGDDKDDEP